MQLNFISSFKIYAVDFSFLGLLGSYAVQASGNKDNSEVGISNMNLLFVCIGDFI